ncbi:MAG: class I SAM-dependent methyltransferase [Nitrososphaeraceae archaeon]
MKCRMCHRTDLELFLDLGFIPRVDRFLTPEELNEPEVFFPLSVYLCKSCGLAQLGYIVPAQELFNGNYAYESSTTKGRRDNHLQLANYVCNEFKIPKNSLIVDIGSNVGMLLEFFKQNGMHVIGVDASSNVAQIGNSKGIKTIIGFFNDKIVRDILAENGQAAVITATNVFAHIQDYDSFMLALTSLLSDDGIFVFQVPHFLQLVRHLEYDTIYHEHISYFGIKPLIRFFERFDLELFDVIETEIDGGSIRCFVSRKGKRTISNNIKRILDTEEKERIYSLERLKKFAEDVKTQKKLLIELLVSLGKNSKIVGIGAPAKGMTMLNYCKIDADVLDYVTEKSSLKIGKFTPGMHIPVKPDDILLEDKPDYAVIFAWNFAEEIMKNLEGYKKAGGKFIIPIPHPRIV